MWWLECQGDIQEISRMLDVSKETAVEYLRRAKDKLEASSHEGPLSP